MSDQKTNNLITLELPSGEIIRARQKIDLEHPQQTMNQLLETEEYDLLGNGLDLEQQAEHAEQIMRATALQAELMEKIATLLSQHLDRHIYEIHPDFIDDEKLVEDKQAHLYLGVQHNRLDQLKIAVEQAGFDVRSRPDLGFLIDFNPNNPESKKIYIIAIKT